MLIEQFCGSKSSTASYLLLKHLFSAAESSERTLKTFTDIVDNLLVRIVPGGSDRSCRNIV